MKNYKNTVHAFLVLRYKSNQSPAWSQNAELNKVRIPFVLGWHPMLVTHDAGQDGGIVLYERRAETCGSSMLLLRRRYSILDCGHRHPPDRVNSGKKFKDIATIVPPSCFLSQPLDLDL